MINKHLIHDFNIWKTNLCLFKQIFKKDKLKINFTGTNIFNFIQKEFYCLK
jgi:hypothetical protein